MIRGRLASVAAMSAAVAIAGCGTDGHDLMVVERDGSVPGAELRLRVVFDGQVSCDGGPLRTMPSGLLIDAREVERDLEPLAESGLRLRPRPGSTLRYRFAVEQGTVAFADNSGGRPPAFARAALLVRRIAKEVCGRAR